jgi:hypothetical protein
MSVEYIMNRGIRCLVKAELTFNCLRCCYSDKVSNYGQSLHWKKHQRFDQTQLTATHRANDPRVAQIWSRCWCGTVKLL